MHRHVVWLTLAWLSLAPGLGRCDSAPPPMPRAITNQQGVIETIGQKLHFTENVPISIVYGARRSTEIIVPERFAAQARKAGLVEADAMREQGPSYRGVVAGLALSASIIVSGVFWALRRRGRMKEWTGAAVIGCCAAGVGVALWVGMVHDPRPAKATRLEVTFVPTGDRVRFLVPRELKPDASGLPDVIEDWPLPRPARGPRYRPDLEKKK